MAKYVQEACGNDIDCDNRGADLKTTGRGLKMKRVISIFLVFVLVLGMGTMIQSSKVYAAAPSGSCGANATWRVSDGVLTISGQGEMEDYGWVTNVPWRDYSSEITKVVIEDGITKIGKYSISSILSNVTNIIIGNSVTSLDEGIMNDGFANLENVWIGTGLNKIYCWSLPYNSHNGVAVIFMGNAPQIVAGKQCSEFYSSGGVDPSTVADFSGPVESKGYWFLYRDGKDFDAFENKWLAFMGYTDGSHKGDWVYPFDFDNVKITGTSVKTADSTALEWSGNENVSGYQIQYSTSSDFKLAESINVDGHDTLSSTLSGLQANTKYYARVRGVRKIYSVYYYTNWSDVTDFKTDPFYDVKRSNSYFNAVNWASSNGIVNGTSAGWFSPENPCTRYQIVTMMYKYMGKPEVSTSVVNPFTDVPNKASYKKAVLWAYSNGIVGGTSKTTFSPNAPCTRYQVVVMLWKLAGKPDPGNVTNPFKDVSKSNSYYKAVMWAYKNKITGGTSKDTFSPNATCKRYQIVTFLYKFNKIYKYME